MFLVFGGQILQFRVQGFTQNEVIKERHPLSKPIHHINSETVQDRI